MEILFDVKKDNLNEEEKNFKKGVNQILEKINDCQNTNQLYQSNLKKIYLCQKKIIVLLVTTIIIKILLLLYLI